MNNRNIFSIAVAGLMLSFSMAVSAQALYVTPAGDVGVGTETPAASLEVRRSDGSAQILVDDQSAASGTRNLFSLQNRGLTKFIINNRDGAEWAFANKGTSFRISRQGSGAVELEVFNNGDATLQGVLTENSDVNSKQDIEPVAGSNILEKLSDLEISEWSYKDAPADRHVGPMAQDFYAAFGLGHTDKGIATLDSSGIALAAIKALIKENTSLKERLSLLESQQAEMQAALAVVLENQHQQRVLTSTVMN
jgi:hypothetical protein